MIATEITLYASCLSVIEETFKTVVKIILTSCRQGCLVLLRSRVQTLLKIFSPLVYGSLHLNELVNLLLAYCIKGE
jgi:hypothetical protein